MLSLNLKADFKLQPSSWTCGPTALHNALLAMGERHSIEKLAIWAGSTATAGTSEKQLMMAAREFGFELGVHQMYSPHLTQEQLRAYHRLGQPQLACVDRDSSGPFAHWIAIVYSTKRHVWIADSSHPGPVLRRLTWRQFMARLATVYGPNEMRYDLYPLRRTKW